MEGFFEQLSLILDEDATLPFLQHFVAHHLAPIPMDCRHRQEMFRPAGTTACFSAGTTDLGKAMGIKKSTIVAAAYRYARRHQDVVDTTSTKVRVHQLMMLAACDTVVELQQCFIRLETKTALLHLCGHGICSEARRMACVNPAHLVWGDQATNIKHVAAHEVLELVETVEEYTFLLALYQRNPAFEGLF